jgi:hypothetical protein
MIKVIFPSQKKEKVADINKNLKKENMSEDTNNQIEENRENFAKFSGDPFENSLNNDDLVNYSKFSKEETELEKRVDEPEFIPRQKIMLDVKPFLEQENLSQERERTEIIEQETRDNTPNDRTREFESRVYNAPNYSPGSDYDSANYVTSNVVRGNVDLTGGAINPAMTANRRLQQNFDFSNPIREPKDMDYNPNAVANDNEKPRDLPFRKR